MKPTLAMVEQELRGQGVIPADAPASHQDDSERPWFILLLQGMAGWLAGLFLLVFLGIAFRPDEPAAILPLGGVLLGAAWAIYRLDRDGLFFDQFALALSIAGQCAVAWGVAELQHDFHGLTMSLALLLLQLLVWWVMPNRTARTLAILFAAIAWTFVVRFLLYPPDGGFAVFDSRGGDLPMSGLMLLLGWLLTWGPPLAAVWRLLQREPVWMASSHAPRLRPALTGLLVSLSLGGIAADPFALLLFGMSGAGLVLGWWALFPLLSIGLAFLAATAAFRLRSLGLLGLAIVAALLQLARFYYLYGTTLLWKSVIMLCAGAVLLGLGEVLRRRDREPAS